MSIENMKNSVEYINQKIAHLEIKPDIGMILGSGLGKIADDIKGIKIPYPEIPGFKSSTIQGHTGNLVIGELCSKNVIAMQGRLHLYEGHSLADVVYSVRIMKLLGVKNLIVTNAAGGINKDFTPGDLMLIKDHINFTGKNPLTGQNLAEFGTRFPNMSDAYSKDLINTAQNLAEKLGIGLKKGVYAWVTGPSYETPAEVRMLRTLGADAVGMSTVPEVIIARHSGINVLGISCITNMATGILDQLLSHQEVIETAARVDQQFTALVRKVVEKI